MQEIKGEINGLSITMAIEWLCLIPLFDNTVHVLGEYSIAGRTLALDFIDETQEANNV